VTYLIKFTGNNVFEVYKKQDKQLEIVCVCNSMKALKSISQLFGCGYEFY